MGPLGLKLAHTRPDVTHAQIAPRSHDASGRLGARSSDISLRESSGNAVPDDLGRLVGVHLRDHARRRVVVEDGHRLRVVAL
eukprot:scaffold13874_cov63-Phaeocystis_antarctica.AAC.1